MSAIVWPLLIYWLTFSVVCLAVVQVAQDQLYDEVVAKPIFVILGSLIFAGLATWLKPSFDTIFTSNLIWTLLQAIVWFAVFVLFFQFHPVHALGLSLVTLVLVSGLATMGVDSLMKPKVIVAPSQSRFNQPVRKSLMPPAPVEKEAAPAK